MVNYTEDEIRELVINLTGMEKEQPWLEFKHNNKDPQMIGSYISAIANAVVLEERDCGYIIWGIDDVTHNILGTDFDYSTFKVGNEDISLWLTRQLSPVPYVSYRKVQIEGKMVGILKVSAAETEPTKFANIAYIRRGEHKKKLKDCPDLEKQLWKKFSNYCYEKHIAKENVSKEKVLELLEYESYFKLLDLETPSDIHRVIEHLEREHMIQQTDFGGYNILNLGAVLFARKMHEFPDLQRKAVRIIQYKGNSKIAETLKERISEKGYACGFEELILYVNSLLPVNEIIGQALRSEVPMYPLMAVREVIANAIIHQDLSMRGTGITIEIFRDRIEVSNPGDPLIAPDRFIDHPPISRNEAMASFMRRVGICEERGSGFDKVVAATEEYQLPAPVIEIFDSHTRVILFAYREFGQMDKDDKIRACYMHACLKRVNREYVTNTTLRERFNIDKKNSSMISRLLKDTLERGLIKLANENAGDRGKRYLPYWA